MIELRKVELPGAYTDTAWGPSYLNLRTQRVYRDDAGIMQGIFEDDTRIL